MRRKRSLSQARTRRRFLTDGGEDDVCGVALAALEEAASEVSVGLHVTDDGLDGRAAPELALDDAEYAAFLAGDEDAAWIGRVVTAISLIDIGALDRTAGESFGRRDGGAERVAIIGIARQCAGMQHELAAGRAGIGGDDRSLDAELIGALALPLPMHSTSGAWNE